MTKNERKTKPIKAADATGVAKRKAAPGASAAPRKIVRGAPFKKQSVVRSMKKAIARAMLPGGELFAELGADAKPFKLRKNAAPAVLFFVEHSGMEYVAALHDMTKHAGRQTTMDKDLQALRRARGTLSGRR
jgi:histone H3/H4